MLVMNLVDMLIASCNAAVVTQGGKFDGAYIMELLPQLKSEAQGISYNGGYYANGLRRAANPSIDTSWKMIVPVTIQSTIQIGTNEFLIAKLPGGFIRINSRTHGINYCGAANISANFHILQSVSEVEDYKNRGFLKGKEICVVPVGAYLRFYGNKALKNLEVHTVPHNPLEIPGFNPLTDEYPLDDDTISILKDLFVFRAMKEAGMITDKINDGAQTNEQGNLKTNIRTK